MFYDIDSRPVQKNLTDREKGLYVREIKRDIAYFSRSFRRANVSVDITGCSPDEASRKVRGRIDSSTVEGPERSAGTRLCKDACPGLAWTVGPWHARKDEIREQRIAMEAVVDAYGSGERAMGWYYYLDRKMMAPFKARCRFVRPISVLKVKDEVEVLGWHRKKSARAKCLSGFGGPANELPSLWHNCDHCRKIKKLRRPSVIGSTGRTAGTNCERRKACPSRVAPTHPALKLYARSCCRSLLF